MTRLPFHPTAVRAPEPPKRPGAVALLAATALLASCVTDPNRAPIPRYEPPATGARLVVRGFVPTGDTYLVTVLADADRCTKPQLVGSGNAVQHPESTTLATGEPATIDFNLVKPLKQWCTSRWTFTPQPGRSYLVAGVALPTGCVALISDMSDADHLKPEPSALHRNPKGGATCLPIAESKPLPVAAAASAASAGEAVLRDGATTNDLRGLIAP